MDGRRWTRGSRTTARVVASLCAAGLAGLAGAAPATAVGGVSPLPDGLAVARITTAVADGADAWGSLRPGHAPGTLRAV